MVFYCAVDSDGFPVSPGSEDVVLEPATLVLLGKL